MGHILLQSIFLGFILVSGRKCHEFMTLNVPPSASFPFHPHEDLTMDPSEIQPVFLYASSQNDFVHQNLPQHVVPSPPHQQRHPSYQRQKFVEPPPTVAQKQRNNNGINIPPLTYGFQPKPSTRVHANNNPPKKTNNQNQYGNGRFVSTPPRKPVIQEENRQANQPQSNRFSEKVRVHNVAHHDRRNAGPSNGFQTDPNQSFDYLSHILSHDSSFQMLTSPGHLRHGANNPGNRNTAAEIRNPTPSHHTKIRPPKVENKEENGQKRTTFADTVQAFKDRYNSQNNGATFPLKNFGGGSIQNFPEPNRNERLNLQPYARSMRVDNRPQLPVRPLNNNGGIRINTVAGELPIFQVDPIGPINKNSAPHVHSSNHRNQPDLKGQEKRTYLLIKAPPTTTENPSLAPLVAETIQHSSTPLFTDNLADDNLQAPELFYPTPMEPRSVPENNLETPEIVLDLVQVPDPTAYEPHDKSVSPSAYSSELRSDVPKDPEVIENIRPTEGYPTTPMHYRYDDDLKSYRNHAYSLLQEDQDRQNEMAPKPKIRDPKKSSNASYDQPKMSFSSSVSVVSVKQRVDAKPKTSPRKPKTTTKKKAATPAKKKVKPQQIEDTYDDYDASENVPGEAGVDYPAFKDIPSTRFDCKSIKSPGFYADLEAGCQVFHNCDTGMAKHSFMCPNGTIFHQELLICDWWYNVKCEDAPDFYSLNSGLYITDNAHDEFSRRA